MFFHQDTAWVALLARVVPRLFSVLLLLINVCSISVSVYRAPIFKAEHEATHEAGVSLRNSQNDNLITISAFIEAGMLLCVLIPAAYFAAQLYCTGGECCMLHCTVPLAVGCAGIHGLFLACDTRAEAPVRYKGARFCVYNICSQVQACSA